MTFSKNKDPRSGSSTTASTPVQGSDIGRSAKKRDQSLPPCRRVQSRRDFLRIQQVGQKHRTKHMLVAILPRSELQARKNTNSQAAAGVVSESRIGITVTTKVHKRAVRRNLFKRRVREVFRRYRGRFERPYDVVVIALNGATDLDYQDVEREFCWCLRRAGLLPERNKSGSARDGARR